VSKLKNSIGKNVKNLIKPTIAFLLVGSFLFLEPVTNHCFAAINASRIYQLQQRLIDNPRDIETHLTLAMEYSVANDFIKAVEAYFTLLRVDPNNFHAYNNLGILYKKSGQYRDSLFCYDQAERIDPQSPWVPFNKGLCYESIGRLQDARENYGRALSLNPGFNQALQRIKALSGNSATPLPDGDGAEMQIFVASAFSQQPSQYQSPRPAAKVEPAMAIAKVEKKPAPRTETISERLKKIKENRDKTQKHRTKQKGEAGANFNKAMDAFELGNTEKALKLYAESITQDRNLLAEPDNGLIKAALKFLKDNPTKMSHGLYYRGLLIYISGHLELASTDLKNYLKANPKSPYSQEAKNMVNAYEQERQAIIAARKAKREHEALLQAKELASKSETEASKPRASDYMIQQMNVDQVIAEADRLSRDSRISEALAVIETGLSKDPQNLKLLMKSGNAYTDLLLVKGDNEAGRMALKRFEQVYATTPENSREWAVAKDMIFELKKRIK
jgi:tetratricopeptide (TPR) repeat protein